MNDIRTESYLDKCSSLIELPSNSSSIFGHILWSHFIIHEYLNLLNATDKSNVQEFVWIETEDGCIILDKCLSPIPHYFTTKCRCNVPDVVSVSFEDIKSTEFCACRKPCENAWKKLDKDSRKVRTLTNVMYFCKLKSIIFLKTWFSFFCRFISWVQSLLFTSSRI